MLGKQLTAFSFVGIFVETGVETESPLSLFAAEEVISKENKKSFKKNFFRCK